MFRWLPIMPNNVSKRAEMNDLVVVEKIAQWQRLKALVLDSVSSPITRRVYSMALDEFLTWFTLEPRPGGFCKATVSTWRASLEARGLGSSSIIIRMSAIRKLPQRSGWPCSSLGTLQLSPALTVLRLRD